MVKLLMYSFIMFSPSWNEVRKDLPNTGRWNTFLLSPVYGWRSKHTDNCLEGQELRKVWARERGTAEAGAGSRETGLVRVLLWLEKLQLWVRMEPGRQLYGVPLLHGQPRQDIHCQAKEVWSVIFEQGSKTLPAVPPQASSVLWHEHFKAPSG